MDKIFIFLSLFLLISSSNSLASNADEHNEKLLESAQLFVDLTESLTLPDGSNEIDIDTIVSDEFLREVRPRALNLPVTNWQEYESFLTRVGSNLFDKFEVVIDRFSVDSDNSRVILEARPDAILKDSIGGGTYDQEYLLILEFDKDYKVTTIVEYVDSLYTSCFFNLPGCPAPSIPVSTINTTINIVSSWGEGYCAEVGIENISREPLSTWEVEIDLKSAKLNNAWGAYPHETNSSVTFLPPRWFSELAPQQIHSFGYCSKKDPEQINWQPEVI